MPTPCRRGVAVRAMVYRGPYKIRVEEKDVPAICGSDLHLYHGMMPDTRVGTTFGHEFIGVVEEVGSGVRNLERGDRVMVPFNVFCGTCWFCARGLYSNCHNVNPNATAVGGIYATPTHAGVGAAADRRIERSPARADPGLGRGPGPGRPAVGTEAAVAGRPRWHPLGLPRATAREMAAERSIEHAVRKLVRRRRSSTAARWSAKG
ncbi:alcohol dehydrogenase catalytic domain-containing protein [Amycolatopsis sp. NPDC004772]